MPRKTNAGTARKQCGFFLVLWAMALGLIAPGWGQTNVPLPPFGPPDVVVIVYQRPGMGDQVGITYAHTVPHTQAKRDLGALAQEAGWTPRQIKITDAGAPVEGRMGKMTSVSAVAPNVVHNETHAFPLEAFIRAFRSYKRLALVFFVGSDFQFQGVPQFADKDVQFAMQQHGSAYTYQIQILNPQFDHLNLPQSASVAGAAPTSNGNRRSPLMLFLGILGAAGMTGLLVYFLTARLTTIPKKAEAPPEEAKTPSDETTDKTEIGTRG